METEIQHIDPRLAILMQWLKDNDESGEAIREHANRDSQFIPDLLNPGSDSYD
jgi:hypothetical protein